MVGLAKKGIVIMEEPQNCILTKQVYELYMCLISSSGNSYRRESSLRPFPRHFLHTDQTSKDFKRLVSDRQDKLKPNILENMPQEYAFC